MHHIDNLIGDDLGDGVHHTDDVEEDDADADDDDGNDEKEDQVRCLETTFPLNSLKIVLTVGIQFTQQHHYHN